VVHFLLVYDRSAGKLLRLDRYAASSEAIEARFVAEAEFNGDPNIEIVALAAASENDLRRTHGRYFLGLSELVARMS
jgi:hypothetical protein